MEIMSRAIDDSMEKYNGYENYYVYLSEFFKTKKNNIVKALKESKLDLMIFEPEGGHFLIADITKSILKMPMEYFFEESNPLHQ